MKTNLLFMKINNPSKDYKTSDTCVYSCQYHVNAAKNILAIGTKKKETITGRTLPVRGEGVRLYDSKSRVAHVGVLREKRVGTLVDTKNPI